MANVVKSLRDQALCVGQATSSVSERGWIAMLRGAVRMVLRDEMCTVRRDLRLRGEPGATARRSPNAASGGHSVRERAERTAIRLARSCEGKKGHCEAQ